MQPASDCTAGALHKSVISPSLRILAGIETKRLGLKRFRGRGAHARTLRRGNGTVLALLLGKLLYVQITDIVHFSLGPVLATREGELYKVHVSR